MRTWVRARLNIPCGHCPTVIATGEPLLEIRAPGWAKVRCATCAGEPVPASIDDVPAAQTSRVHFAERIASIRGLAKDFKHAQAGDI